MDCGTRVDMSHVKRPLVRVASERSLVTAFPKGQRRVLEPGTFRDYRCDRIPLSFPYSYKANHPAQRKAHVMHAPDSRFRRKYVGTHQQRHHHRHRARPSSRVRWQSIIGHHTKLIPGYC